MVVYLNDANISWNRAPDYFSEAACWAVEHCPSFISHHMQDVSDVSYQYDFITEYRFNDPKDALLFQLKWKTS